MDQAVHLFESSASRRTDFLESVSFIALPLDLSENIRGDWLQESSPGVAWFQREVNWKVLVLDCTLIQAAIKGDSTCLRRGCLDCCSFK